MDSISGTMANNKVDKMRTINYGFILRVTVSLYLLYKVLVWWKKMKEITFGYDMKGKLHCSKCGRIVSENRQVLHRRKHEREIKWKNGVA